MPEVNEYGQRVGDLLVPGWTPRPAAEAVALPGRYVALEPLAVDHAPALHAALCGPDDRPLWTYRPTEPPADVAGMVELIEATLAAPDLLTFALVPAGDDGGRHRVVHADRPGDRPGRDRRRPLRPAPAAHHRGHRGDPPAMRYAFDDLGYRRFEWKCDSLNEPSRRAATRLGFTYEGTVPPPHGHQGPQPRHRLVLGHRRRVAGGQGRARAVARPGQLRRRGAAARAAERPHRASTT